MQVNYRVGAEYRNFGLDTTVLYYIDSPVDADLILSEVVLGDTPNEWIVTRLLDF